MTIYKENDKLNKSINELDGIPIPRPHEFESYLVKRCYDLANKKLKFFSPEDMRIMIGQEWGLEYLIPMAIEVLKKNPFIETDFYEGDLMLYVLQINSSYWDNYKEQKEVLNNIFKDSLDAFKELDIDVQQDLYEAYEKL